MHVFEREPDHDGPIFFNLRERGKITERHESYISAMKVALEKAPLEKDIRDLHMTELDPEWLAKREN